MIEFGKEEPILNNESLHQIETGVSELCLDHSKGRKMNRYSFICKGESSNSFPLLVSGILSEICLKAMVIATWLIKPAGKNRIWAKVIEKRYLKQGWKIHLRKTHYLAIKEVSPSDINSWPPLGVNVLDVGILILIVSKSEENILSTINEECSSFLAWAGYFAPNSEFLNMAEQGKAIALYQVNNNLNDIGLVVLSKKRISIPAILSAMITSTHKGDSAYKVFV